jgi:hypothetical protein
MRDKRNIFKILAGEFGIIPTQLKGLRSRRKLEDNIKIYLKYNGWRGGGGQLDSCGPPYDSWAAVIELFINILLLWGDIPLCYRLLSSQRETAKPQRGFFI